MRFKQFINEALIGHFNTERSQGQFPIYLNPSIADIHSLAKDEEIRGMTVRDDVYVWPYWRAMHMDVAQLVGSMPDICFYLQVNKINPLKISLSYSEFTGTSVKNGLGSDANLKKLLQFPAMQELKPYITIERPYVDPTKPNSYKKDIHDIKVPDGDSWLQQIKQKWMERNPKLWDKWRKEDNDEI